MSAASMGAAAQTKAPAFLTMRMEDERVTHMIHPRTVTAEETEIFLKQKKGFPVVLSNIHADELEALRDAVLSEDNIFADTAGFKDILFFPDKISAELLPRLIYASYAPVFCLKSTLLLIEMSQEKYRENIMTAENFLNCMKSARKPSR